MYDLAYSDIVIISLVKWLLSLYASELEHIQSFVAWANSVCFGKILVLTCQKENKVTFKSCGVSVAVFTESIDSILT